MARDNAHRLGAANLRFMQGDWFARWTWARFDVIAGNPPYIAERDAHLAQGDLRSNRKPPWPAERMDWTRFAPSPLSRPTHDANGMAPAGHGFEQGAACREILAEHGFRRFPATATQPGSNG